MKSLYLRVWLTVVLVLALFAGVSGWLVQRHVAQEQDRMRQTLAERVPGERMAALAELVGRSLPELQAPRAEQAQAVQEWSQRLGWPLALHDPAGAPIGASDSFRRFEAEGGGRARPVTVVLEDGRRLTLLRPVRPALRRDAGAAPPAGPGHPMTRPPALVDPEAPTGTGFPAERPSAWARLPVVPPGWPPGTALAAILAALFAAVAAGAWPVVRRLTRRLEALERGVERFGAGDLRLRVDASGHDEVARLAGSFNRAAQRIEELVGSHRSLLANASHELRSPLARLKMALTLLSSTADEGVQAALHREIDTNLAELDTLIDEVLLASRLEAHPVPDETDQGLVDLRAVLLEEAEALTVPVQADRGPAWVRGQERLLRRMVRNLLENARRYGGQAVCASLDEGAPGVVRLRICDRGPGVPEALRERIFEPFFRLPGHAEMAGGVGLGLSLVRQIAHRSGGEVRCEPREGGGACFSATLPVAPAGAPSSESR